MCSSDLTPGFVRSSRVVWAAVARFPALSTERSSTFVRPSRVIVEMKGGRKVENECLSAVGGPDRPLPPEVVFEKITALAAPVYPKMRPALEELAALPAARMTRGWSDLVGEICG